MKSVSVLGCAVLLAACADVLGPAAVPAGTFSLEAGAVAITNPTAAVWHGLPWTYDVLRDGQCVLTLEEGELHISDGSYILSLSYTAGCPGLVPQSIRESGTVRWQGQALHFSPTDDRCGSWLSSARVQGAGIEAEASHPCLAGAIHYMRFVSG